MTRYVPRSAPYVWEGTIDYVFIVKRMAGEHVLFLGTRNPIGGEIELGFFIYTYHWTIDIRIGLLSFFLFPL